MVEEVYGGGGIRPGVAIDGLIGIEKDGQCVVHQELQKACLQRIKVLGFVDQDMRIERAVAVAPVGMRAEQLGSENKQILEVDASGTLGRLVERQEFLFVAGLRAKRFDPAHSLAHLLQRE